MKIAFTSCMHITQRPEQPVWSDMAPHQADVLVLLGDSIYADYGRWLPCTRQMQALSPMDYLKRMHALYWAQIHQPQFVALLAQVSQIHAIWDDHDYLWNNANGGELEDRYREHERASRALFRAWRKALLLRNPSAFPADPMDIDLWHEDEPLPEVVSLVLPENVVLHLSDGRSHKVGPGNTKGLAAALLGQAQRDQLQQAFALAPDALHLLASGIVAKRGRFNDGWSLYPLDHQWLLAMAAQYKLVLLSGDVHLQRATEHELGSSGQFNKLYEYTASGAALGIPLRKPWVSDRIFGLLDITTETFQVSFGNAGKELSACAQINRHTWQRVV